MVRRLVQLVALVTAFAACINAQCVVSCSLQLLAATAPEAPARAFETGGDHDCCPHEDRQQNQDKPVAPCTRAGSHDNEARLEVNVAAIAAPLAAAGVVTASQQIPPQLIPQYRVLRISDSPGPNLHSPVIALRI